MKKIGITYRLKQKTYNFLNPPHPEENSFMVEAGDLDIEVTRDKNGLITGGLLPGNVEKQNQALIIYMHPGELKEEPQMGVGINSMLLSQDLLAYKHSIREQLEADGFMVNLLDLKLNEDKLKININATY